MARLFIAVRFPEEIRRELIRVQNQIKHAVIKPVEEFHLTLKFLGEKNPNTISKKLEKVRFNGFDASLTGIGVFPSYSFVRVVWVGVTKAPFVQFNKKIEKCLGNRPGDYHPHITLARVKNPDDKERFIQSLRHIEVKKLKFSIDSFFLLKSILTQEGPIHTILQAYQKQDL